MVGGDAGMVTANIPASTTRTATGAPTKVPLNMTYLPTGSIATRARDPTTRRGTMNRKFGTAGPKRPQRDRKSLYLQRLPCDPGQASRSAYVSVSIRRHWLTTCKHLKRKGLLSVSPIDTYVSRFRDIFTEFGFSINANSSRMAP